MYGNMRFPAFRLPVCALACFLFDNENEGDNLYPTCRYLSYIVRKKVKKNLQNDEVKREFIE